MNKWYVGIIVAIVAVFALAYFSTRESRIASDKMQVVTSFYPLYFFASAIGGERADVRNITPAGAEPHDYEPTAQDLIAIQNSDLVILNGAGLEPWSENVLTSIPNAEVVIAGEAFATLEGEAHEHEHEAEEAAHEEEHEEHVMDPHVWLSPKITLEMVDRIEQGFVAADPENESYYADNAESLRARLTQLDAAYTQGLAQCASRDLVTSHAAFGYLAAAYGLHQEPISGLSPEEEPSAQELAEVTDFAREHNVQVIFFESLVSPALAQTIAKEIDAQTAVLDPIEGLTTADIAAGKTYFTQMEQNLESLKSALQCKA